MEISIRLKKIADMVDKGYRLADIGTDHGYIPIYLTLNNKISYAYACDINKGPLTRAYENIKIHSLQNKIEVRLGSGLSAISADEAEIAVIAGMGGLLSIEILNNDIRIAKGLKQIILQPQSHIEKVRLFLTENGFKITDEIMLIEDGKYYTIINSVPGYENKYSKSELYFGRKLIEKKDSILKMYTNARLSKIENILIELEDKSAEKVEKRSHELRKEKEMCEEVIKCL